MVAVRQSLPMISPKLLKEFKQDYETVQAGIHTALSSVEAENQIAKANATLKRTRFTRLEVGRALKRMHDTGSFSDKYRTWELLCGSLKLNPGVSYRLMSVAEVHDAIPTDKLATIPGGLSQRKLTILRKAEPEEREATIKAAADAGDPGEVDDEFAELAKSLNTAPLATIKDEARPQPKPVNVVAAVRRHVSILQGIFSRLGLSEELEPLMHADAIVALASTAHAGKAA